MKSIYQKISPFIVLLLLLSNSAGIAESATTVQASTPEVTQESALEVAQTPDSAPEVAQENEQKNTEKQYATIEPAGIYAVLDAFGCILDIIISRGDLSPEHQKMYEEVARSLHIEHRGTRAKNMGLLPRVMIGYANAFAVQLFNRTYFNEDWLHDLTDDQKRFLMAHELTHHRKNHSLWTLATDQALSRLIAPVIDREVDQYMPTDSVFKNFFKYGGNAIEMPFIAKLLGIYIPTLNMYALLDAQISQKHETESDTEPVTVAGLDPEFGISLFSAMRNPDTSHWPLYARVRTAVSRTLRPIYSLPPFRIFSSHPPTAKRIAHLQSLKALAQPISN